MVNPNTKTTNAALEGTEPHLLLSYAITKARWIRDEKNHNYWALPPDFISDFREMSTMNRKFSHYSFFRALLAKRLVRTDLVWLKYARLMHSNIHLDEDDISDDLFSDFCLLSCLASVEDKFPKTCTKPKTSWQFELNNYRVYDSNPLGQSFNLNFSVKFDSFRL